MHPARLALALAALAAAPAVADQPCFCLQDPDTDRPWYDCIEYRKRLSPDPFYDCFPSTDARERRRVENGHRLRRVPDGEPPCRPCREPRLNARNTCRHLEGQPGTRPEGCP
jgi:hypothetical protein